MRCGLCGEHGAGIDAGGDLGSVHRSCFLRWDRAAEAYELATTEAALSLSARDPAGERPSRRFAAESRGGATERTLRYARARLAARGIVVTGRAA